MSFKLVYDRIEGEKLNEINDSFKELLEKALSVSNITGKHRNAKFAKMLTRYVKDCTSNELNIQFSGKDIKRLLFPKKKRVYTKHSLEIIYYMVFYIMDKGNVQRADFLNNNAEYILEIYNRINLMESLLEEREDIAPLLWQEARIHYFVNGIPQYITI